MTKIFGGWTNGDGTRMHDAPAWWPFGTIGPMTEYSTRYVPPTDDLVYEKPIKERKKKVKVLEPIEASPMPGTVDDEVNTGSHAAFDYIVNLLPFTTIKVKSK